MKKWMAATIFVVIVASAICAYLLLFPPKPVVFEGIVPDSAIYYISATNLNKKIQDFKDSKFFLKFSQASLYKKYIAPSLSSFNSKYPFLKDLMNKDIAVAVFTLGKTPDFKHNKEFSMEDLGDFSLLIRLERKKIPQLKRKISDLYAAKYKDKVVSNVYQGVRISSVNASGGNQEIDYAILSDTVVISNSLENILKSIDLFKNKNRESLANNTGFQKTSAKIKKESLLWGYKNSKNYYEAYLKQLQETGGVRARALMEQMKFLRGMLEAFGDQSFYIDYDKQAMAFISKSYTVINASKDNSGIISIIARDKAVDQKVFSLIPNDAIGYYACNQDMLKCWDFLVNAMSSFFGAVNQEMSSAPHLGQQKSAPSPEAAIKEAESFLGIDLKKDLIALFGNNFGMVFASLDEVDVPVRVHSPAPGAPPQTANQRILFPRLYFFCEVKDGAKFENVMGGILQKSADNINAKAKEASQAYKQAHPEISGPPAGQAAKEEKLPVTLSVENYKGVNVHYLEILDSPFPFIQPSYCVVDDYFVFSLSRDSTKKIIEICKSNNGAFNSNAEFALIKNKLPPGYSAIFFLDFRGAIKSVEQSSIFKKFVTGYAAKPNPEFSVGDLDSLLTTLNTLKEAAITIHKVPGENAMESQVLLTIEE